MSNLDEMLYESLEASCEPSEHLNHQIMDRRSQMSKGTMIRKGLATAATFGCLLLAGGTVVYAIGHYLSPAEIATEFNKGNALAKAFKSKSAITVNETQKTGDYIVTLLGMVSGKDLELCISEDEVSDLKADRSYIALAISMKDGTLMKEENKTLSPLVSGIDWRDVTIADMDATLHWFTKDGVVYELLECDDLEIFAGRGVQLGVVDQFGDESEAFKMDKATGKYEKTGGYEGCNALFTLPIDPGKGDESAVTAYLERIKEQRESVNASAEQDEYDGLSDDVAEFERTIAKMSAEEAGAYIKEHCRQTGVITLPYDDNGDFKWGEDYTDESILNEDTTYVEDGSSGMINVSGYKTGVPTYSHASSDGTTEGTTFAVITINDDHTVTMETYALK